MKQTLIVVLSFLSVLFSGQEKEVESKVKQYAAKIDSIVASEKSKMHQEMDKIDAAFQKEQITHEERMAQKKAIADQFENRINTKVENEKLLLQNITQDYVKKAIFKKKDTVNLMVLGGNSIINGEITTSKGKTIVLNKRNKQHPKNLLEKKQLAISYGFLNLSDEYSFDPFDPNSRMRIGNSHSFEIQSRRTKQLGSYSSPLFISYGLAYRSDTYMPKRPLVFSQNNGRLTLEEFTTGTLKRSKLRNVYLTLPVDFHWVINPSYTQYEGVEYVDTKKKQFKLGLGVYAGINLRNIIKVKYYDSSGDFDKYKYTIDEGVNSFLWGTKISLSYGGLNFFIKKDLSPIFNNQANLPFKNGIQVGVDLMDLNF